MTTNRLILIFLGIIFLIIIILGSNRIATSLRQRFANFLPKVSPTVTLEEVTPTPISFGSLKPTITPISSPKVAGTTTAKSTANSEIPATGPTDFAWLILGGSGLVGLALKKLTSNSLAK